MPLYFRKAIGAGPFRFNFSRGGVGVSVGVKGLRFGTGPRGHYVHAGRNGIYYRSTIGRAGEGAKKRSPAPVTRPSIPTSNYETGVEMVEVESGDVLAMRDAAFSELLDEINAKRQQLRMATVFGWTLTALGVLAFFNNAQVGMLIFLLAALGWGVGRWLDSYRRTCVLFYDLDPDVHRAFEDVAHRFDAMVACAGKWHIEAGGIVQDITTWKRNAGATRLVRKKTTALGYKLPQAVTSNITPPAINVGKQAIYFLPDVALIDDGGMVGAVAYDDLAIAWQDSNFIEEGAVPRDAEIIRYTWQHPNKNGGPDRRFRDNRQIPVCRYEAMHLSSSRGINELVEFSKAGTVGPFANALKSLPKNAQAGETRMRLANK